MTKPGVTTLGSEVEGDDLGKILKKDLRAPHWKGQERRIK